MSSGSDPARRRTITVFITQGLAGLSLMLWVTWLRFDQALAILHRLQPNAAAIILILIGFATALAFLKFELTELIYVSLVLTAYTVIIPILGVVIASWLAVGVAGFARILALKQIGPAKIEPSDHFVDHVKTFGFFGTYGIPVVAAATLYELLHGELPLAHATFAAGVKIAVCGVVLAIVRLLAAQDHPARQRGHGHLPPHRAVRGDDCAVVRGARLGSAGRTGHQRQHRRGDGAQPCQNAHEKHPATAADRVSNEHWKNDLTPIHYAGAPRSDLQRMQTLR